MKDKGILEQALVLDEDHSQELAVELGNSTALGLRQALVEALEQEPAVDIVAQQAGALEQVQALVEEHVSGLVLAEALVQVGEQVQQLVLVEEVQELEYSIAS